jgi:hypothetical protein
MSVEQLVRFHVVAVYCCHVSERVIAIEFKLVADDLDQALVLTKRHVEFPVNAGSVVTVRHGMYQGPAKTAFVYAPRICICGPPDPEDRVCNTKETVKSTFKTALSSIPDGAGPRVRPDCNWENGICCCNDESPNTVKQSALFEMTRRND